MSRSSSSQTSRLVRSRLLALPLVAVCAVAYMGSVLHFAMVQHVTCLEHGEVVHVGEEGSHEAPLVEASFDDVRVTTRAEAPAGHGAEAHCLHSLIRREAPPSVEGAPALMRVPTRSAPAMSVFRFHAEPVARLHLAPKASPPLA
ncbi:hypothetical protein MYSTI_03402 [Myxococcus stipitatus DSM 14675]|uniref:Uncharacterized protein n=1 Tax=Myxococcus stipitatus (strain DSM 14675 / JCM 12634 / Mx s8) TaxID=1278073 RepID=L7UE48_MYXSD|nr:hypothetical protein [Myxococcus stipitatus]AGC44714.1 hypothetical protein MYSTI_03402 [Myxococcus stipitatus DSM 14675]